ncbi:putative permease of the major facilitator superfamily [Mesorhizobium metallidurans STM 2683]|uniref:Putative permease of the major facilitator superfamily n=1 Tax=Mesorhizobium metallidurans STM 2683 TaxID=1297569 RepID=M5EZT0_9HYPH|nr:MFS transporter [Mesorhizobium metallidurans]CCV09420.1 putative permease of the major facilitator superfamily [Mesorhizobium metallidurans STM 2683]
MDQQNRNNDTRLPPLYWAIFAVLLVGLNLRPAITTLAPVIGNIEIDEGLSSAAAGFLTSIPLLAFVLLSTSAPRFGRKLGFGIAIQVSLIILICGFALRLLPTTPALFLSMAVVGVGITIGNVLLPAYIKQKYPARAGPLSAVYTASLFIGPALAAAGTIPLANFFGSWRLAIASWGLLAVAAFPIWWPHARSSRAEKIAGGDARSHSDRTWIWRNGLAWSVTLYFAVLSLLFYTISAWLPTILADFGENIEVASRMLSLVNIVAIPFTLAVALAVHKVDNHVWATTGGAVLVIVGLAGVLVGQGQHTLIWMFILGAGLGVEAGIGFSLPILRVRSSHQTAILAGMSQTVGYSVSALGPVGAGALHDFTNSWEIVLTGLIVLVSVQILFGWVAGSNRRVDDKIIGEQANET